MELSTARRWKLKRERSKEKKAVDLWKTQLSLPQIHTTNYNKSCFIFYKILSKQRGELYALSGIYPVTYGNYHIEIIMINVPGDLSIAFQLNYPEFPDSWFLVQFF